MMAEAQGICCRRCRCSPSPVSRPDECIGVDKVKDGTPLPRLLRRMQEIKVVQDEDQDRARVRPAGRGKAAVDGFGRSLELPGDGNGEEVKVAVAVGRSSSSLQALQWALDHLFPRYGNLVHLLHVQSPVRFIHSPMGNYIPIDQATPEMVNRHKMQRFIETEQLLSRYKQMCQQKEIRSEVICAEGERVKKALVEQIRERCIPILVLGTSPRSRWLKVLRRKSIPSAVTECAPEFCTVIVINKGQIYSRKDGTESLLSG